MRHRSWRIACLVALVAVIIGCDRQHRPLRWTPPAVGERSASVLAFRASFEGPDGPPRVITSTSEMTSETLAVTGDMVSRLRIAFVREETTHDGVPRPGMSGVFEIADTPGGVELIKHGGAPTEDERDYLMNAWAGVKKAERGRKQLAARTLVRGDRFQPTAEETLGLGLQNVVELELTVRELSASEVLFDQEIVAELATTSGIRLHATGTLRVSNTARELVQDGELRQGETRVGTLHVEQRSHRVHPN